MDRPNLVMRLWVVLLSEYEISLSVTGSARLLGTWEGSGERSESTDGRTFPNPEARSSLFESQSTFDSFISKPDTAHKS